MWSRWLLELLPFSIMIYGIINMFVTEHWRDSWNKNELITAISQVLLWLKMEELMWSKYKCLPFSFIIEWLCMSFIGHSAWICRGVGLRNPISKLAISPDDVLPTLKDHLADISHQSQTGWFDNTNYIYSRSFDLIMSHALVQM